MSKMRLLDAILRAKRVRLGMLERLRRQGELVPEAEQERRELRRYADWADKRAPLVGLERLGKAS